MFEKLPLLCHIAPMIVRPKNAEPGNQIDIHYISLATHANALLSFSLQELFADPSRAPTMQISCGALTLDFSHQRILPETLPFFEIFAQSRQLAKKITALTNGDIVNHSEQRPALHTALRDPSPTPVFVNGENIKPQIRDAFEHMRTLCKTVWQSGIKDVLILGIGGSYWGSLSACEALRNLPKRLNIHFLAEMEAEAFDHTIHYLAPENTVVIIISKSFTTVETLANAQRARKWLGPLFKAHSIAVTANNNAALDLGIVSDHILPLWPWVGGRYSVWSSVGIPIALCYGIKAFEELQLGAHQMDQHADQYADAKQFTDDGRFTDFFKHAFFCSAHRSHYSL